MSAEIRFPNETVYWIVSLGGAGYADGSTRPDQVTTVGSPLNLVWIGADYNEYLNQCMLAGIQPRISNNTDPNLNLNQSPRAVSARQIRLWLINNNINLSTIETILDTIPDEQQKNVAKVEWEYAPYIERNHPMVDVIAGALGLNEEQINSAFIEASQI